MLRPATPLSLGLLAAFALLLISIISTPVIKAIPLSTYHGTTFGVFGYCKDGGACSSISIGYDTSSVGSGDASDFDLPSSTRNTLSSILVIHPVAAFMTLVMFALAAVAHFHSPSHSVKYLLLMFIVSIVTFLVCLLAFLVDVLLFVPHLAWGSYLVLAATILVALSSLVSCAMRRTVVGRKARQKHIAENAEMSGENFFSRQAKQTTAVSTASAEPSVPTLSGANGDGMGGDRLPEFAAFERKADRTSDERIPLTAQNSSQRPLNDGASDAASAPIDASAGGGRELGARSLSPPRMNSAPPVQFDQFGNPVQGPADGYDVRRGPSAERMNMRGRGGMPPGGYRGRGGYGPGPGPGPGRGGVNNYGPPQNGRGNYGAPPRAAGYGPPPGSRGGYGPRGHGPGMRGGRPPPPGYSNGPGLAPYDRRGSPAGYPAPHGAAVLGRQPSPGPQPAPGYANHSSTSLSAGTYEAYNPDRNSLPRAESPPPLPAVAEMSLPGHAAEMDVAAGGPSHAPQDQGQYGLRESDADVDGMLALQQNRTTASRRHDTYMSDESMYSQDDGAYVPPRQAWNQGAGRSSPRMPSPLNAANRTSQPSNRASPGAQQPLQAGEYYEDVDPRFAAPPTSPRPIPPPIQATNAYENIPRGDPGGGERSPVPSEKSTFTSVSQRGSNVGRHPAQPPPMSPSHGQSPIPRRPVDRSDVLLRSNPEFELPTTRTGHARSSVGMVPGSAYPEGPL